MAKAMLVLEDMTHPNGEPGIKLDTSYEGVGGFDPESHAHQHALLLVKYMGTLAERRGETTLVGGAPDPLDPNALQKHLGAAELAMEMDSPEIAAVPIPDPSGPTTARGLVDRLTLMRAEVESVGEGVSTLAADADAAPTAPH